MRWQKDPSSAAQPGAATRVSMPSPARNHPNQLRSGAPPPLAYDDIPPTPRDRPARYAVGGEIAMLPETTAAYRRHAHVAWHSAYTNACFGRHEAMGWLRRLRGDADSGSRPPRARCDIVA